MISFDDLPTSAQTEIKNGIKAEVATKLFSELRDDLQLLTLAQVAGLLNVNPKTVTDLPDLKRVTISGTVIRYRACDVAAFIKSRT